MADFKAKEKNIVDECDQGQHLGNKGGEVTDTVLETWMASFESYL
jgi:hypothetical protein